MLAISHLKRQDSAWHVNLGRHLHHGQSPIDPMRHAANEILVSSPVLMCSLAYVDHKLIDHHLSCQSCESNLGLLDMSQQKQAGKVCVGCLLGVLVWWHQVATSGYHL